MNASTIEIRAYANPSPAGYVYFAALVSPADATGTIHWYVDNAWVTNTGLTNGLVTTNNMDITPAGDHLITAVYSGDATYAPSAVTIVQVAS